MLFIREKPSIWIFMVIAFIKLQNDKTSKTRGGGGGGGGERKTHIILNLLCVGISF